MLATTIQFPRTDAVVRTLPNGLEFIVKEDHAAPVVSVQVWVRTGSCDEGALRGSGISHLVEHMVFKGTADLGPAALARRVQAAGGYLNAYTSFDRTVYYVDAPVEGLDAALDTLTDLVARAAFPEDEFEREKDVIRREIDMGEDDPGSQHSHQLFETIFSTHPMGEPIIGHLELFNRLTHAQMTAYYRERYVPDNMFFVIAGPVSAAQVEKKLAARLGHVPRGGRPPVLVPDEPEQLGRRETHTEFSTDLSKLTFAWRVPGLTHPDVPALEVLSEILGQGRSSRLFRRLREEKALVHAIGASCYTPPTGGVFAVSSELDFDKRDATRAEVLALIEEIKERGVTEAEVTKAQKMVLGEQLEGLTTMRGLAGDLGSNWHAARNLDFTRDVIESLERVTPATVQEAARTYLREQTLTVVSLNPRGSLAKAAARRKRKSGPPVDKYEWSNGLTLLVKEDRRVPLVSLHAGLRGGILAETRGAAGLSRLFSRALIKGTTSRSAEEIATLLEESGGGISTESGGSSWSVNIDLLQPDLAMGLDVLADVLLRPTFPEAEVKREKEVQLAAIRAEADRLTSVAFKELREALFGPHPFAWDRNGTAETLSKLDSATLKKFHRRLAVTGNLVLAVFGDVERLDVKRLVEDAFVDLPAGPRVTSPAKAGFASGLKGSITREVLKDKKQAVLAVGVPTVDVLHPDRAALDLLDEACSDMASRLFLRIREEQGLAYYTGAFQIMGMAPGAFVFYLGTSPEQLDHAQSELLDEIHQLARHGLDEEELERVKASWLGKHVIGRQSPESLARGCALDELYGLGYDHHAAYAEKIQSLTADEVRRLAKKYFDQGRMVVSRVRPQ